MNEEQIKKLLLILNFDVMSQGFLYWIKAIEYRFELKNDFNMQELYREILKRLNIKNKTKGSVERCMRHCRKDSNIKEYYNYNKKGNITNKEVLNLIFFMEDIKNV